MAFPPGFLDELRSRISLSGLIARRVKLVRRGREFAGLCPFHHEKTPSFYVVEDKSFFHCFGCGAHGDAIGFAMRADNLDFIEAVEKLAGEAGLAVPQATPQERERAQRQKTLLEATEAAAAFYEERLWAPGGVRAREYLQGRGLDPEIIRRFRLGWAPDDRQALRRALAAEFSDSLLIEAGLQRRAAEREPSDYFRNRVMFPISDRAGRVIAFGGRVLGDGQPKYLNSPDSALFEKGRVLYGWSAARAAVVRDGEMGGPAAIPGATPGAIVTEGYMDVIALHQAGFATAVAPLGTALTEFQLHELWRLAPEPVLCFDGDAAGQRAAARALRRALPLLRPGLGLRFVMLRNGEDPDSVLRARGRAAFEERLAAAQSMDRMLWQHELSFRSITDATAESDLRKRLDEHCESIGDRRVRSAYKRFFRVQLDEIFPWHPSGSKRSTKPRPTLAVYDGPPAEPPSQWQTEREKVLLILLEQPIYISQYSEQIAAISYTEPPLKTLQERILEAETINCTMNSSVLRDYLFKIGCGPTIEGLLSSPHIAPPKHVRADPELMRIQLEGTLDFLRNRDQSEVLAAERAFAASPTEENSERLTRAVTERQQIEQAV